ncbi:hypothetical protein BH10ACI2_BH10ACI2_03040 [soil metagenome]
MSNGARSKQLIKSILVIGALTVFVASCIQQSAKSVVPLTASETPEPIAERVSSKEFKAFDHKISEHKQFACTSCHQREGKSLKMDYAGHDSCIGCHLNQFTNKEQQAMCSICHDDLKSNPPTMKTFPVKFIEGFNMKFDHASHDNGKGRPPEGCSSCHETAGPGKTIPAGFQAHTTCYSCHTPESKIGSCSVCHDLAPYNRTPQSRYVFKAVFRHGDHNGVGCGECHDVRAGAAQSRQVTNIVASEHNGAGNNCATCHNGSRSFGGNGPNDFANCAKCHRGAGFNMLPGKN